MDTNITKTWIISIDGDEIFSRCTNETLYQAYNRLEENKKYDAIVIQDDDRGQFDQYYAVAIANLSMMLAKRMEGNYVSMGKDTTFTLGMHDNHDDNILPILSMHCNEYVMKKVLELWYHADFGSELERFEINHCLQYRKFPVRGRIDPLF